MKKALLAAALAAFATSALANVAGTSHDLSENGPNTAKYGTPPASQTACGFCHAVHNANPSFAAAPLWNRPDFTPGAAWVMYPAALLTGGSNPNSNATGPAANSLTCLTCHEGTAALGILYSSQPNNVLASPTRTTMDPIAGRNLVTGNDLTNDHPVSFSYQPVLNVFQTISSAGTSDANVAGLPLYGATFDRMECGTCHDPHEDNIPKFLRIAPAGICGTCHLDK